MRYMGEISPGGVSVQRALTHAATAACIDVLASSVSSLPLDGVRYQGVARVPVEPPPSLLAVPSATVELDVWLYQLIDSMCTDGNAFGLVVATQRGWPSQVELLDPTKVRSREVVDGVRQAVVDETPMRVFPYGDLVHIPGKLVRAGSPFAESPLARASETIASALSARTFGYRFFVDGAHPSSIIYADNPDLDETQAEVIKQKFLNSVRGTREPAVFGAGLKHEQVSVNPNESQFIDLMRWAVEEACRFYRVPPNMVFAAVSGQNVTYANVSQADLHYLKHSLDTYLVRIERALTALMPRPQVARFNRNALLRADAETRNKVYDIRLRNETLSINEVRAAEDELPFDGDEYHKPGIPGLKSAPAPDSPPAPEQPRSRREETFERDEFGQVTRKIVRVVDEDAE